MVWKVRRESLVSQHIEVALVYHEMLGLDEAVRYLEQEGVPEDIIERVLFDGRKRHARVAPVSADPMRAPDVCCRRKNRVHDAIVEAALKLEQKHGRDMALALLKEEQVPDAVAARIVAPGPRQLRARRQAA
jgi:hypothetical protein